MCSLAGIQRLGPQLVQDPAEREEEADPGHSRRVPLREELLGLTGPQGQPQFLPQLQILRLLPPQIRTHPLR